MLHLPTHYFELQLFHEGSIFYFPIITLPVFMWHEVENFFYTQMDRGWMYGLAYVDLRYLMAISTFIMAAKAYAGDGQHVFCPGRDCNNLKKFVKMEQIRCHLITRGS